MNTIASNEPKTIDQVRALAHDYARTHAGATVIVGNKLPPEDGPITSRKLFMEAGRLVYEFYRVRNKENKFYIIF